MLDSAAPRTLAPHFKKKFGFAKYRWCHHNKKRINSMHYWQSLMTTFFRSSFKHRKLEAPRNTWQNKNEIAPVHVPAPFSMFIWILLHIRIFFEQYVVVILFSKLIAEPGYQAGKRMPNGKDPGGIRILNVNTFIKVCNLSTSLPWIVARKDILNLPIKCWCKTDGWW